MKLTVAPLTQTSLTSSSRTHSIVSVEDVFSLKWLKLQKIVYTDREGSERVYERFARTTRSSNTEPSVTSQFSVKTPSSTPCQDADSVVMVAITQSKLKPSNIVLVRQFRPASEGYTIEMPAGLIDKNESIQKAALRELKEETGFIGEIVCVSPKVTQTTVGREELHLVTLKIDLDLPENQSPIQSLEPGEDIEVLLVPLNSLLETLHELSKNGNLIFDELYNFAYGLSLSADKFFDDARSSPAAFSLDITG